MSVTELLPTLQKLSRADKFRLMQFLVAQLAQEETDGLQQSRTYPVWSPDDAFEAADTMLKALEAQNSNDHAEC